MKTRVYFDVCCDKCGRCASADWDTGFFGTRQRALAWAKQAGWRGSGRRTLCPDCYGTTQKHKSREGASR